MDVTNREITSSSLFGLGVVYLSKRVLPIYKEDIHMEPYEFILRYGATEGVVTLWFVGMCVYM